MALAPMNVENVLGEFTKKTVAYVVTDENDDGSPVIEKWSLKKNVVFS